MKRSLVLVIYLAVGFVLYGFSFGSPFLLDDEFQILNNPQVLDLSNIFLNFTNSTMAMSHGMGGVYYKPVMMIIYNLLWNGGGGSAVPFHVFQLLIHVANSFLIFNLFQRLLTDDRKLWAFFAGLLFLSHPANSESVLMIADLQEPLYTFFGLAGLLILSTTSKWAWTAAVFFLLSLLSKESGLLYLLIAPAYCYLFERNRFRWAGGTTIAATVIYLALRLGVAELSSLQAHNMQISQADFLTRILSLPKILVHYVYLFFTLERPSLTQDWVVSNATLADFWFPLGQIVILLGVLIYSFYGKPRKEYLFLMLWVILGLGLHSQIIPLDGTVSDRWVYFPIIGAIGVSLWLLKKSFAAPKRIKMVFLLVITLSCSISTFARTRYWVNPMTLYRQDLKGQPDSFYLNNNLGLELLKEKNFAEAIPFFEKTIAVSKKDSRESLVGYRNLGAAYLELKDYTKAEECFRVALAEQDVRSYRAMVLVLSLQNKEVEFASVLKTALDKFPADSILLRFKK